MSLLNAVKTDVKIEDDVDVLGGGGALDSGLYNTRVGMAYMQKSKGGALGVFLTLLDGKKEIREAIYVTSGDAKGNKTYYEKDGAKNPLPGFTLINSLCLLTVGKELSDMEGEMKVVNVYNADAGKEVPTEVEVLTELMGKEVLTALFKQTVNKTKLVGSERVTLPETKDENSIDKFFRTRDRMTAAEIRAGATTPVFIDTWVEKWTGVTKDKTTTAVGKAANQSAAPSAGGKPAKSLFA